MIRQNKNAKALKIHSVILLIILRLCTVFAPFFPTVKLTPAIFKRSFLVKYTKYAYIHAQRVEISKNQHFVFGFTSFLFLTVFQPSFWQEVDDAERWITIPNRVMSAGTHMPNFMKIGSKLWPWQCACIYNKYGGRDVINYANEPNQSQS